MLRFAPSVLIAIFACLPICLWAEHTVEEMKAFADRGSSGNYYVKEEDRTKAMGKVGWMYYKGEGGATQDFAEAARWFRRAADRGDGGSESMLGVMYYKGEGVARNLAESFKWFNHAAARGNAKAGENRDKIKEALISEYLQKSAQGSQPPPTVVVCQSDITAYNPASVVEPVGTFKEGTLLEIKDAPSATGMKNATLRLPDGKVVEAVCFAKDFEKPPTITQYTADPLQPQKITGPKKAWGGEPDWKHVEDDPNFKGIKPKGQ